MNKQELIFIAAHSRSGSTLLERALSTRPDTIGIGEVRHIWTRGLGENQACGCGKPFRECDFWAEVLHDAFGAIDLVDVDSIIRSEQELKKGTVFLRLAYGKATPYDFTELHDWARATDALIQSIFRVSGKQFVIDSSKTPTYGIAVARLLGISNTRVIHLIRDPRAVALSRMTSKRRPEVHWKEEYMPVTSPIKTAMQWNYLNLACEVLVRTTRSRRIKYEEFARKPESVIRDYWSNPGEECSVQGWSGENTVVFPVAHTVSGNPIRFATEEIMIKPDERWRREMPRKVRWQVSTLTMPFLALYGYNFGEGM